MVERFTSGSGYSVLGVWLLCLCYLLPVANAEPLNIAVSQTPLSSPFFVAQKQNLFAKHGLDVKLIDVVGGHRAMNAVLEGRADFGTSSDMVITNAIRQAEAFNVLASFVQSPEDSVIIARKDRQISRIADLKGKTLGLTLRTSSHYYADTILLLNGMVPGDVNYRNVAPENMAATLASGEVDAVSTWQPWGLRTLEKLGSNGRAIKDVQAYTLTFNLVSATTDRARRHAQALLKVLIDAEAFINNRPHAARTIVADALQLPHDDLEKIWQYYLFSVRLDQSLLVTIESEFRWRNSINPPALTMGNLLDYFTPQVLHSLDADRVTLIH